MVNVPKDRQCPPNDHKWHIDKKICAVCGITAKQFYEEQQEAKQKDTTR